MTTQDACSFYGQVSLYGSFGGVVLGEDESGNIAAALGDKNKGEVLRQMLHSH